MWIVFMPAQELTTPVDWSVFWSRTPPIRYIMTLPSTWASTSSRSYSRWICRYSRLPVKSSGMNVCSTLPCDVCTHPVTSIPTPTPPCVWVLALSAVMPPSTERNMIIIPPRKVFWRKSEPMQAMWILKCSLSCYPFFPPPVISVDMPMRREKWMSALSPQWHYGRQFRQCHVQCQRRTSGACLRWELGSHEQRHPLWAEDAAYHRGRMYATYCLWLKSMGRQGNLIQELKLANLTCAPCLYFYGWYFLNHSTDTVIEQCRECCALPLRPWQWLSAYVGNDRYIPLPHIYPRKVWYGRKRQS